MKEQKEEFAIPITEDLMREHGILNRTLLIYDEIIRRIDAHEDFPIEALQGAIAIIKSFIEDYHEKIEEDYLFPLFEKAKKEIRLVKTLRSQHTKGRALTAQLLEISITNESHNKKLIKKLLKKFIDMYRPHEAREDTELFPLVRSLISEKEFDELSEISENMEHALFGEHGFESILNKVATIEKELGIYELEKFTPVDDSKS
jgi:hemerythrin-like domain-containing protein